MKEIEHRGGEERGYYRGLCSAGVQGWSCEWCVCPLIRPVFPVRTDSQVQYDLDRQTVDQNVQFPATGKANWTADIAGSVAWASGQSNQLNGLVVCGDVEDGHCWTGL